MTDEPALLTAIRAHPGEDTPRLAYADWLDEHAGEVPGRNPQEMRDRATLIRTQIELTRLPEGDPGRSHLVETEAALLMDHLNQWEEPLRRLGATRVVWERGFPTWVAISAEDLLADPGCLFACAPITTLRFTAVREEDTPALASCSHLSNLTTLYLHGGLIGNEGAQALAASPHLANLTRLDLYSNEITDDGARALADSPHLASLTELDLSWNDIGVEGARALAASPRLPNLVSLNLEGNDLGPAVQREISSALAARTGTGGPGTGP